MIPSNRAALAGRPDLLERLDALPAETGWRTEAGPRGATVLAGPNGPATSRYDPVKEAAREAEGIRGGSESIALVVGFGLGDLAREVLARGVGAMILYEPEPGALRAALACAKVDDVLADPRATIVLGGGAGDAEDFLAVSNVEGAVDPVRSHRIEIVSLPAHAKIRDRIRPAVEESWMRSFGDVLSSFAQESLWFANAVRNLRVAPRALSAGARPLDGSPAILVAAGPSLAKNLDALAAARGRIPVVAVDTALRALAGRGIRPDAAVSVDANPANESDLEGLPEAWAHEVLHFSDVVAAPRFHETFTRTFAFRTRNYCLGPDGRPMEKSMGVSWMLDRVAPEIPAWQSGGSVATNALSLLCEWGADPVIFVGQDLAVPGGNAHVADVAYEEAAFAAGGRFSSRESTAARTLAGSHFRVPAWGGAGEVATTRILWTYLRWYESTKAQGFGKGRRWIDATEGGSRKKGFEEMPLARAIETHAGGGAKGYAALAALAELPPLAPDRVATGLARLADDLERFAGEGSALLGRARDRSAEPESCDAFLDRLRREAFLLEGLALRHLRAAWKETDSRARAALLGKIVEESGRHAAGVLRRPAR